MVAKGTELYEEARVWLQTPRARQDASQRLRLKEVQVDPEEICMDVLFKIWKFIERHPDRDIENVRWYCARIMDNLIVEILRGFRFNDPLDDGDGDGDRKDQDGKEKRKKPAIKLVIGPSTDEHCAEEEDLSLPGRMRACVEASGHPPTPTSAVLTYLTLQAFTEKEIDVNGLPQAKRGARKDDHARWWPSLHLAHQDADLFPWMDRQYPAQRQRLRRARQAAEQVLARATFIYQNGIAS